MKEDYLWDRTGTDADIERIEGLLRPLAFNASAPAPFPQRTFEPAQGRGWRFFRPALGFAFAAVVIAYAALWFPTGRDFAPVPTNEFAVSPPAEKTKEPAPVRTLEKPSEFKAESASYKPRPAKKKPARTIKRPLVRLPKEPPLVLTAEEAHAYRQLMTALSITSTNLRRVRDTVDGTE